MLQRAMLDQPQPWRPYYHGEEAELRLAREFGYSDRSRHYWPLPEVQAALAKLVRNLSGQPIPLTLLSQYLPDAYRAVRAGALPNDPLAMIRHQVLEVADADAAACRLRGDEQARAADPQPMANARAVRDPSHRASQARR